MGLFDALKAGLEKTRRGMTERIGQALKVFTKIDEELFEEIEEILITSDVGVEMTQKIVAGLKDKVKERKISEPDRIMDLLKDELAGILDGRGKGSGYESGVPSIILVVGVNGVGKTTSIGKIAYNHRRSGRKVIVAAADTFRAAAIEQLEVWCKRAGADIIQHNEGADPAAVVFDALQAAKARRADVVICDTAGRLHTKKNLMEELKKINRVIDREMPEARKETLLVLDATTGQNAVSQARLFKEAVGLDGIILTKLDGTAKGGIIVPIKWYLGIPIRYVGVGEAIEDLQEFDAREFVEALFD